MGGGSETGLPYFSPTVLQPIAAFGESELRAHVRQANYAAWGYIPFSVSRMAGQQNSMMHTTPPQALSHPWLQHRKESWRLAPKTIHRVSCCKACCEGSITLNVQRAAHLEASTQNKQVGYNICNSKELPLLPPARVWPFGLLPQQGPPASCSSWLKRPHPAICFTHQGDSSSSVLA